MKYLGIDYGAERVGISVSDAKGTVAFPRAVLLNDEALIPKIAAIREQEGIEGIVIGDTRSHGGAENSVTAQAERFAERIARETGVPVSRAFEAWSSVEASRHAPKGKRHNDAAAAAFILQRFLDMRPH